MSTKGATTGNLPPSSDLELAEGVSPPFSIFTRPQKRWIAYMASFGAMFSTLNSYIYYPAVVPMSRDLGVSVTLINLTITCYLVMAGIAPAFMGDFADHEGRRPAYLTMLVLMIGSNIGLALAPSYPALFVLRIIQSAGSSGVFGAAHGVISDVAPVEERGSYTGTVILFTNTAPSFGPILSGALTYKLGWRWIFWFLTILTTTYAVALVLFFPETHRKIVENGSKQPRGLVYRSLFLRVTGHKCALVAQETTVKRKHHFPNPLACLPLLVDKANFLAIMFGSTTYATRMTLQASLGSQCIEIYNLNYLMAGLIYLPGGVAGAIGAKLGGIFVDKSYRTVCHQAGNSAGYRHVTSDFPIESARLRGAYSMIGITAVGTIGYGIALGAKAHISVMLIMQVITGFTTSVLFSMSNTLLTDLNLERAATVRGASNLVRCCLAGGCIAALQPLVNAIGFGGCFGIYATVQLIALPAIIVLKRRGPGWRRSRDPSA